MPLNEIDLTSKVINLRESLKSVKLEFEKQEKDLKLSESLLNNTRESEKTSTQISKMSIDQLEQKNLLIDNLQIQIKTQNDKNLKLMNGFHAL